MNIDLLRDLCAIPGVPGREHRVAAFIEQQIAGLFDEVRTDPLGSVICLRRSRSDQPDPTRIMLLCHMDEIGFLVRHVSDKGWIAVEPVGGFDPRTLFGRRVMVCTDNGDYLGVMNAEGRPIHTATADDTKKIPEPREFFVDVGLGPEAAKKIKIGDFVVMDGPLVDLGSKIVSKALDNRIACWLAIEAIRALEVSGTLHSCEIHVAFTTQEEVGLRGAKTASFSVAPDIGIGIDVTLAGDTPGVSENEAVTQHGKGFGLHIKDGWFIADRDLVEEVASLATKENITFQRCVMGAGGQDGAAAQQAAAGARAVGIMVGVRYIHTSSEMVDKADLQAALDILAAYLASK